MGIGADMTTRRALLAVLVLFLLAFALVGCSAKAQNATFLGYKVRPAGQGSSGVAIVQLSSGLPVEATCTFTTLENGTPIKVVRNGDTYEVVSSSPDWTP